jgi:hypothetical protein
MTGQISAVKVQRSVLKNQGSKLKRSRKKPVVQCPTDLSSYVYRRRFTFKAFPSGKGEKPVG